MDPETLSKAAAFFGTLTFLLIVGLLAWWKTR